MSFISSGSLSTPAALDSLKPDVGAMPTEAICRTKECPNPVNIPPQKPIIYLQHKREKNVNKHNWNIAIMLQQSPSFPQPILTAL